MFEKIKQETGVTDIEELVDRFVDAEEKNFQLFTKATTLESEIKMLEEHSARVEAEIEKYRGQGAKQDSQRKRVLYDMEQRLETTNARADSYEQKYVNAQKVLQLLKSGVQTMYDQLERGASGTQHQHDRVFLKEGVSEENISQYLGVVELRAKEILQAFKITHEGDSEAMQRVLGSPPPGADNFDTIGMPAKAPAKAANEHEPKAVVAPVEKLAAMSKEETHLEGGDKPQSTEQIKKVIQAKAEDMKAAEEAAAE